MCTQISKWTAAVLLGCAAVSPAQGQYSAVQLPIPSRFTAARAYGASEGQQVGALVYGYGHAALWNGVTGSPIDLDPGQIGSTAFSAYMGYQGGESIVTIYRTGGSGKGGGGSRSYPIPHAVLWHGSAGSMIDLNPTGAYQSVVSGLGDGVQVGWAAPPPYYSAAHAHLWKGTSASALDLNPSGFIQSWASGVNGDMQVGYGSPSGQALHALLWLGTAQSAVDLHPTIPQAVSSVALAVDAADNEQVGYVAIGTTGISSPHAYLWSGTASSGVDLNPAGMATSEATATHGGYQAGFGAVSGQQNHALLWQGSAANVIDLHKYLPTTFTSSQAFAIDADGSIVGTASSFSATFAVIWRIAAQPFVTIAQNSPPGLTGWSNVAVIVSINSPFSTPTDAIAYRVNGGATQQIPGNVLALTCAGSALYHIEAYATNGLGAVTPTQGYTLNVDTSPPFTVAVFARPMITLVARDVGSGVLASYYQLDGGGTITYSGPFSIQNTAHTLVYWSVDRAGNTEVHRTVAIFAVAPTLTSIAPTTDLSGSPAFTLTVTGTGFITTSQVLWNGSPRVTTYLSSTQLLAAVTAADVAAAGVFPVSVVNPAPGTGSTGQISFTVLQEVTAAGAAANITEVSSTSFDLSPVTSYTGFTFTGRRLLVNTGAGTIFLDKYGNSMTAGVFFDILQTGQGLKVVGSYSVSTQTLNATTVQMQ